MYGREYDGRVLRFEPSGGLLYYSLVMQDKETDSYWSIMTGESLAGRLRGTRLRELPVGEKARFKDWVARHPDSLVLSVEGREHDEENPYEEYLRSEEGARGSIASDARLATKAPIFSFRLDGLPYAVPHEAFEGGGTFDAAGTKIFLYRPEGADLLSSSVAYRTSEGRFARKGRKWRHVPSKARFLPASSGFEGAPASIVRLDGFDTFWFNWSETHPDTVVLGR